MKKILKICVTQLFIFLSPFAVCQTSRYLLEPIDEVRSMPGLFSGHNLQRMIDAALQIPSKSQYESDASYVQRANATADLIIYGSTTLRSRVAVAVGKVSDMNSLSALAAVSYDANAELLTVCFRTVADTHLSRGTDYVGLTTLRIAKKVVPLSTYVGANVFNARVRIRKQSLTAYELSMPVAPHSRNCSQPTKFTNSDARAFLPTARLLVVGQMFQPYAWQENYVTTPTITDPIDEIGTIYKAHFWPEEIVLVSPNDQLLVKVRAPQFDWTPPDVTPNHRGTMRGSRLEARESECRQKVESIACLQKVRACYKKVRSIEDEVLCQVEVENFAEMTKR